MCQLPLALLSHWSAVHCPASPVSRHTFACVVLAVHCVLVMQVATLTPPLRRMQQTSPAEQFAFVSQARYVGLDVSELAGALLALQGPASDDGAPQAKFA